MTRLVKEEPDAKGEQKTTERCYCCNSTDIKRAPDKSVSCRHCGYIESADLEGAHKTINGNNPPAGVANLEKQDNEIRESMRRS